MPLIRRVPKRGFNSKFPNIYQLVNLDQFKGFHDGDVVTPKVMRDKGLIKSEDASVKILGNGDIKKALNISAHKFSKSAIEKIQKSGGKAELIGSK